MNSTCPACKSTNTKDASIRENNGIYGPGAASWVVEEKSICNDCGVYFKPMANEPTIEIMDLTIARFMGMEGSDEFIRQNYQYHKSWDMLMPVVEKIERLENSRFGVCIDTLGIIITDYKEEEMQILQVDKYPDNGDTKISMTHSAVYQFITWLNQQKQKDESKV